jgi:hypothetical protein
MCKVEEKLPDVFDVRDIQTSINEPKFIFLCDVVYSRGGTCKFCDKKVCLVTVLDFFEECVLKVETRVDALLKGGADQ